ncbi:hypothetical protein BaRGS_00007662 [Batillaria attramentaria]|uniref:Uncharacterized protein n=1 Tax=Batillaria attramentaria TaxID=370345 RepID=A0ABD0LQ39_9CAEN
MCSEDKSTRRRSVYRVVSGEDETTRPDQLMPSLIQDSKSQVCCTVRFVFLPGRPGSLSLPVSVQLNTSTTPSSECRIFGDCSALH